MKPTRVASVQMTSGACLKNNLEMAKSLINSAVKAEAGLVVLPEMFAVMGIDQSDQSKFFECEEGGPIQDFLSIEAKRHGVWIVGGTIPIRSKSDPMKARAATLITNDQGEIIARYDKVHLFDVSLPEGRESYQESQTIEAGEDVLVLQTPFGCLGVAVCYDLRFPELFRRLQERGAEIIALPAAFTHTTGLVHWETLVKARAIENLSYLITACQTGTHPNGRKTFGHSMIVNPWGEIISLLPDKVGVILGEVDLSYLHQVRETFPALSHRIW